MKCNYIDYRKLTEELFYGVARSEHHMNKATHRLHQYILDGGGAKIVAKLGVGIRQVTKSALLLPDDEISYRFVYISGDREGEELDIHEIESIGMFFPGGAYAHFFDEED